MYLKGDVEWKRASVAKMLMEHNEQGFKHVQSKSQPFTVRLSLLFAHLFTERVRISCRVSL